MSVEQRLFLAFALSLAVLLSFNYFFAPPPKKKTAKKVIVNKYPKNKGIKKGNTKDPLKKPLKKPPVKKPIKNPVVKKPVKKPVKNPAVKKPIKKIPQTIVKAQPPFSVETPLLKMTFDPRGASLKGLVLKKFLNQEKTAPFELLKPYHTVHKSFLIYDLDRLKKNIDKKKPDLDPATQTVDPLATSYWKRIPQPPSKEGKAQQVVFEKTLPDRRITIRKVFEYFPDKYHINLKLAFRNNSDKEVRFNYRLNGPAGISVEKAFRVRLEGFIGKYTSGESSVSQSSKSDSSFSDEYRVYRKDVDNIHWVGISDKYFTALLQPKNLKTRFGAIGAFPMGKKAKKTLYNLYGFLAPTELKIPPRGTVVHQYLVYMGPKDPKILSAYKEEKLEGVMSYGWWIFAFFCKLFLAFLHFFHTYILANYGVAIICMTLLVKGCLFPLDYKAQRSMMMMQKIQPKMKAIQAKYKGKKGTESMQKQQKELMALYQENGVNPLGGCLPMLLQLPVFIGLYQVLSIDISLRQAKFFGWINDLSRPDSLVVFDKTYHLLFFSFSGIHILPMIMVVLMVVQQKLQPKTDDPQQQQQRKIFMFVMLFMGLLFYNFPSGLVLYFIFQSLISLLEQKTILRHLKAQDEK